MMDISHAKSNSVLWPDFSADVLESISTPGLAVLSLFVAAAGARFFTNLLLTPEEKAKRKRRKLISRIKHPSRSKFCGAARCFRQRFEGRRLRWV